MTATTTEHAQVLNLHLCSSEVSLPSLLSLSESLGVLPNFLGVGFDKDKGWAELPDLLFSDLPKDLLEVLVLVLVLVEVLF